ncbi:MAG: hypothetical protein JOY81_08145 [Alphaproteobacteria bacterium]|nr:hypothetical protein [Alphaproteobacteria bacterium]
MERPDKTLLAAYLLAAILGTWQRCLLANDGAVFLTAAWLGNTWDLYFSQDADRAVSLFLTYGPALLARQAFGLSADAFLVVAHVFYFAVPAAMWLALRALETERLCSRLYLAIAAANIYFPTEVIAGYGLWLIWFVLVTDRLRTAAQITVATVLFGGALAFTHPSIALAGLVFVAIGTLLTFAGRPIPRRSLIAVASMSILLLAAYLGITSRFFPATNPTVVAALAVNRYDFINPIWMIATITMSPALAALWLLLLAPGMETARLRWRISGAAVAVIMLAGLWFAAAGTSLLTWLHTRHTAGYVLAVSLALALVAPAIWAERARRPLMAYSAVIAAAAISYNVDLALFGRFVDRHLRPGAAVDVDANGTDWPPPLAGALGMRSYFKWGAGADYRRDVVVPMYDWYRLTLAFYSYYRSDRQGLLFHALGKPGEWLPYFCPAVARTATLPHDPQDRWFLGFLAQHYCVP